jgi:hypothetical protein
VAQGEEARIETEKGCRSAMPALHDLPGPRSTFASDKLPETAHKQGNRAAA